VAYSWSVQQNTTESYRSAGEIWGSSAFSFPNLLVTRLLLVAMCCRVCGLNKNSQKNSSQTFGNTLEELSSNTAHRDTQLFQRGRQHNREARLL
jgi:hypothetical protein